jgi:hypothetical protein
VSSSVLHESDSYLVCAKESKLIESSSEEKCEDILITHPLFPFLFDYLISIRSASSIVDSSFHVRTTLPNKILRMVSVILHSGIHVQRRIRDIFFFLKEHSAPRNET